VVILGLFRSIILGLSLLYLGSCSNPYIPEPLTTLQIDQRFNGVYENDEISITFGGTTELVFDSIEYWFYPKDNIYFLRDQMSTDFIGGIRYRKFQFFNDEEILILSTFPSFGDDYILTRRP